MLATRSTQGCRRGMAASRAQAQRPPRVVRRRRVSMRRLAPSSRLAIRSTRAGADWARLLPAKAVVVGDSRTVKHGMHLSAVHWALVSADAKCELASVLDGVALVKFANAGGLTGEARFALATGRVARAALEPVMTSGGSKGTQKVTFEMEILKAEGGNKPGGS